MSYHLLSGPSCWWMRMERTKRDGDYPQSSAKNGSRGSSANPALGSQIGDQQMFPLLHCIRRYKHKKPCCIRSTYAWSCSRWRSARPLATNATLKRNKPISWSRWSGLATPALSRQAGKGWYELVHTSLSFSLFSFLTSGFPFWLSPRQTRVGPPFVASHWVDVSLSMSVW